MFQALDFHSELSIPGAKDLAGLKVAGVAGAAGKIVERRQAAEEGGLAWAQAGEGAEGEGAAGQGDGHGRGGVETPGKDAMQSFVVLGRGFVAVRAGGEKRRREANGLAAMRPVMVAHWQRELRQASSRSALRRAGRRWLA